MLFLTHSTQPAIQTMQPSLSASTDAACESPATSYVGTDRQARSVSGCEEMIYADVVTVFG